MLIAEITNDYATHTDFALPFFCFLSLFQSLVIGLPIYDYESSISDGKQMSFLF